MGNINYNQVKQFLDSRSKISDRSATTFEKGKLLDEKTNLEQEKIFSYLNLKKSDVLLDLGAGYGFWSFKFSPLVDTIYAIDFCNDFVLKGKQIANENNINNINFICAPVFKFELSQNIDVFFLSGILTYLNDVDVKKTLELIKKYSKSNSKLILREPTGIFERYELQDVYSEELKTNYSAIYRTKDEFISLFENIGYKLIKNEDMFPEGSLLNKRKETKLRIYLFENKSS